MASLGGTAERCTDVRGSGRGSRHRAAGLAHAAPGTVGDVLAALEQAGFDEIHEQDLSSEAAQSTDRISKRWLMLTFLTSPSAWVTRASQEFMEATVNYDKGLCGKAYFLTGSCRVHGRSRGSRRVPARLLG